ncbi:hypothetical protein HK405_014068 [Cladochytrium tenue]|nr:hypothetical protein HK405_014068 [Cladochytrium tenue]
MSATSTAATTTLVVGRCVAGHASARGGNQTYLPLPPRMRLRLSGLQQPPDRRWLITPRRRLPRVALPVDASTDPLALLRAAPVSRSKLPITAAALTELSPPALADGPSSAPASAAGRLLLLALREANASVAMQAFRALTFNDPEDEGLAGLATLPADTLDRLLSLLVDRLASAADAPVAAVAPTLSGFADDCRVVLLAARKLFHSEVATAPPDRAIYAALVQAYAAADHPLDAYSVWCMAIADGVPSSAATFNRVLHALAARPHIDELREAFVTVLDGAAPSAAGMHRPHRNILPQPEEYSFRLLITAYCRAGRPRIALGVFRALDQPASRVRPAKITYDTMLRGLAQARMTADAAAVFDRMAAAGHRPDRDTYNQLLAAYVGAGDATAAVRLLDHLRANQDDDPSLAPDTRTYNVVLAALARARRPRLAARVAEALLADPTARPDASSVAALMLAHMLARDMPACRAALDRFRALPPSRCVPPFPRALRILMTGYLATGHPDLAAAAHDELVPAAVPPHRDAAVLLVAAHAARLDLDALDRAAAMCRSAAVADGAGGGSSPLPLAVVALALRTHLTALRLTAMPDGSNDAGRDAAFTDLATSIARAADLPLRRNATSALVVARDHVSVPPGIDATKVRADILARAQPYLDELAARNDELASGTADKLAAAARTDAVSAAVLLHLERIENELPDPLNAAFPPAIAAAYTTCCRRRRGPTDAADPRHRRALALDEDALRRLVADCRRRIDAFAAAPAAAAATTDDATSGASTAAADADVDAAAAVASPATTRHPALALAQIVLDAHHDYVAAAAAASAGSGRPRVATDLEQVVAAAVRTAASAASAAAASGREGDER